MDRQPDPRRDRPRDVVGVTEAAARTVGRAAVDARDLAVGLGGPALAGSAAVAAQRLSEHFADLAGEFAALADAIRDLHLDALRDQLGDFPRAYLDDVIGPGWADRHDPPDADDVLVHADALGDLAADVRAAGYWPVPADRDDDYLGPGPVDYDRPLADLIDEADRRAVAGQADLPGPGEEGDPYREAPAAAGDAAADGEPGEAVSIDPYGTTPGRITTERPIPRLGDNEGPGGAR